MNDKRITKELAPLAAFILFAILIASMFPNLFGAMW